MEKHVTALGAIYIGFGILSFLIGITIFWLITGAGLISGRDAPVLLMTIIGIAFGSIYFILAIARIVGGIGLLKRQGWARILVLILGFLGLLEIPIGTAIGVYTLWVLLQERASDYFKRPGGMAAQAR